ncbi:unnamed protein product [Medioppia subpectinata]|uniref:C-type lectin domain-containing protein n=1 Tax=Medioppia subpectinata TaxID=1979941 RepID=A0A7R9Q2H9_9ACAR|nr:unnamed protein product [Medioppia subpectinata]CAG2109467.1 unnamed protein product [Medioppia subpectinata]
MILWYHFVDAQSCPDKWTATEHHCYRHVVGAVATEAEAKSACAALASGSVPVTVHNNEDNTELRHFLGTSVDTSFYIGLEYKPGTPVGQWDWLDSGNARTFHLWDNTADASGLLPCAFINMVKGVMSGWLTNDCKQPMRSMVCQIPVRSLNMLYEKMEKLTNELQQVKHQVGSVPIGFIYVQLPHQNDPGQIWGTESKWTDVTASYAGLFFRAEGGGSAAFNPSGVTVQESHVFNKFTIETIGLKNVSHNGQSETRTSELKEQIKSGEIVPEDALYKLNMYIDIKNAHPQNTAVKIWRRSG